MADISAVFGTLLALGIIFPGTLCAWWLLFPNTVERARLRLEQTPWQCFWLGGITTAVITLPVAALLALPIAPAKLLGWALLCLNLTVASLGAAGLAAQMGHALLRQDAGGLSPAGAFVRAAVALELAAALPVLGWFVILPLSVVTALGATVFALLRWLPRPLLAAPSATPAPVQG